MIEHFILPEEAPGAPLAAQRGRAAHEPQARLPQFAGMKVRCAQVRMEVDETGAPRGVVKVIPYYLTLDDDGYDIVQAAQSLSSSI